jgi:hypothetical protein
MSAGSRSIIRTWRTLSAIALVPAIWPAFVV